MRFIADGPNLPDELLVARDEGQVLFFCGSGVSMQNAKLPDFLGLAKGVLDDLRALPDSAPRHLMGIADELKERAVSGVSSILAADRLFGLLERDFDLDDVERAVGNVLRPKLGTDLTAHQIMLDLSRVPNGGHRLVTTNFDLLLELAAPRVSVWTPDDLPDLQRSTSFEGIVHLHGVFDAAYDRPVGGRLVLSSAEFGRAYLAEGWATRFIRDAIERYSIVFVGYAADDPPVQYLLEALNRIKEKGRHKLYAFQPGLQSEAAALWTHKGVSAIPYVAGAGGHIALWNTLAAWAKRARDPEKWRRSVLSMAAKGPEPLSPHERGQVMHLAMTPDGVKSIISAKRVLSSSWLRTFDPSERYAAPEWIDVPRQGPKSDPFLKYGLDSDPEPPLQQENSAFREREVPKEALNAFISNKLDSLEDQNIALHGADAVKLAPLGRRLFGLSIWIGKICDQPTTVWWVAKQKQLNPQVLGQVLFRLDRDHDILVPVVEKAWRHIAEALRVRLNIDGHNIYTLQRRIRKYGWSAPVRRSLIKLLEPDLKVARPISKSPVKDVRRVRLPELISVHMEYHDETLTIEVPDDQLVDLVPAVRAHLERIASRELETDPFTISHLPPFHADPNLAGQTYERDHGFNALVFWYIGLYRRLIVLNPPAAILDYDAWGIQRNTLFDRLRVWAVGLDGFLDALRASQTLAGLPDDAFWSERGQRDLLLALKVRWASMDDASRSLIQDRLRRGPPPFAHLKSAENRQWQAYMILGRISWLHKEGCVFNFDIEAEIARLRKRAPDWLPEYAANAADSREGRGGMVLTDPSFEAMKDLPIEELIPRALEAGGRDRNFLVERDPFAGLCQARPIRVLRALMLEKEGLKDNARPWTYFLRSSARRGERARLVALIAARVAGLGEDMFTAIAQPVIYWLEAIAPTLWKANPNLVYRIADRAAAALATMPDAIETQKLSAPTERDWLSSALNSPAGNLAHILLNDPILETVPPKTKLPELWSARMNSLLALPEDHGRYAYIQACRSIGWLNSHDEVWTDNYLLRPAQQSEEFCTLLFTSFLNQPNVASRTLYDALKPTILDLVSGTLLRPRADARALAHFLLGGWLARESDDRWLTDTELRTALVRGSQELRTTILWNIGKWELQDRLYVLKRIWPLQLAARSDVVTDRLCTLAFDDPGNFPVIVDAIMPFLTSLKGGSYLFIALDDEVAPLTQAHPELMLGLFWKILPTEGSDWPQDVHEVVRKLSKIRHLRTDSRMIELTRRQRETYY